MSLFSVLSLSVGTRRQSVPQQQRRRCFSDGQSPSSHERDDPVYRPLGDLSSYGSPGAEMTSATSNIHTIASDTPNIRVVGRKRVSPTRKKSPRGPPSQALPSQSPPPAEISAEGTGDTSRFPAFCRYCGKKFSNLVKYKAHEAYHAKEPRFPCRFCGKPSHSKSNMLRHERTHTGEKPFKCRICDRSFTFKENATSHERIHTRGIKLAKS